MFLSSMLLEIVLDLGYHCFETLKVLYPLFTRYAHKLGKCSCRTIALPNSSSDAFKQWWLQVLPAGGPPFPDRQAK